ncbi:MAG: hypothetical protein HY695_22060 [Deltaproteobacteria bacterium]|nr:hypothetical protein [Deltaproteobacteria bacterium]
MRRVFSGTAILILVGFLAGLSAHLLFQRWTAPPSESQGYAVTFVPLPPPSPKPVEIPVIAARDVEKIRALAGSRARIQGRVFRVGHSAKSNTYFLNFGPSRAAFTGVIFASAVELFEKGKLPPKGLEGRELEVTGEIKDHPKYGVEMVLEDPSQVTVLK